MERITVKSLFSSGVKIILSTFLTGINIKIHGKKNQIKKKITRLTAWTRQHLVNTALAFPPYRPHDPQGFPWFFHDKLHVYLK